MVVKFFMIIKVVRIGIIFVLVLICSKNMFRKKELLYFFINYFNIGDIVFFSNSYF